MSESFRQESLMRQEMAVDIAVLKEQMRFVVLGQADMKLVHSAQSEKLDMVLEQLARADGGYRAFMWLGGIVVTLNAALLSWLGMIKGH